MKAARVVAGFALLIGGSVLALPGIPGPGIPLMLAGLLLLSDRYVWAQKALAWLRAKADRLRQTAFEKRRKWPAACPVTTEEDGRRP